ncbi:MAG: ATP-binding cassette domain-containing protein [Deltaproteobacteria bacterium]|nr:ATP-binding cassette domain-containing protein [Deltaproteobacteria bacterium]
MTEDTIIDVKNLSFWYMDSSRPALNNVNLKINAGETTLILGPSGCGKSTLALCLNGIIPHRIQGRMEGEVIVDGMNTKERPLHELTQKVGIVFQDPETQFCTLYVEDEVAFGPENLCFPREEIDKRVSESLKKVHLLKYRKTRLDRLSGGEKQRVALASMLAMNPKIMIFDEPTSNLDPASTVEVFSMIREMSEDPEKTIILIEHKVDEIIDIVDKMIVMNSEGKVVDIGPPRKIIGKILERVEELGIWLPQISKLAAMISHRFEGIRRERIPLTIEEGIEFLETLNVIHKLRGKKRREERRILDGEEAISVKDLSFTYPDGTTALKGISLKVAKGDFLALVGGNGSGKTTLALCMIGAFRIPKGKVFLNGRDITSMTRYEIAKEVGYVFQYPEHQFVENKVYDEVAFSLRVRRVGEEEVRERVMNILRVFSLERYIEANPFSLSQGEKRRLSVATMLVVEPDILILDEPTFGQDERNSRYIMQLLRKLNEQGKTIIMITHDMKLVAKYAKSVAVMLDGKIIYEGTVDELFENPQIMERAKLLRPPLIQLSIKIRDKYPDFPIIKYPEMIYEVMNLEESGASKI